MNCECGGITTVKDSRFTGSGYIRRRRVCTICSERFSTLEIPMEMAALAGFTTGDRASVHVVEAFKTMVALPAPDRVVIMSVIRRFGESAPDTVDDLDEETE